MPRFLVTISGGIIFVLALISYIILKIPPNSLYTAVLVVLISLTISLLFSLFFYFLSKPRGFESERIVYHRALKKAFLIGFLVLWGLIIRII